MSQAEVTSALRQKDIEKTLALEEIRNAEVNNYAFSALMTTFISLKSFSRLPYRFSNQEVSPESCTLIWWGFVDLMDNQAAQA